MSWGWDRRKVDFERAEAMSDLIAGYILVVTKSEAFLLSHFGDKRKHVSMLAAKGILRTGMLTNIGNDRYRLAQQ